MWYNTGVLEGEKIMRHCGYCGYTGHNRRTCGYLTTPDTPKKKTACSWCTELGHNIRTCPNKKHSPAKLAELQPLLEEHISNILLKTGIGRGTLMHIVDYSNNESYGVVTGFRLGIQHYHERVHAFHVDEPQINVVFPNGDKRAVWLSRIPEETIEELAGSLIEGHRAVATDHLLRWGYSSHTVVCKSTVPAKLSHTLKVEKGQTLCGLAEWKKNLTAHLANVKKSEDSEKTVENP